MKKILCVILTMALLATVLLAGCGNTANNNTVTEGTNAMQEDHYKPDSTLRILMVGNSFCYYYVEELYALLMENPPEGIDEVEIYNLYYSGCTLTQHHAWWLQKTANYDLFKVDASGRQQVGGDTKWSLEQALTLADWDYISLQGSVTEGSYINESKREATLNSIVQKAGPLLDLFHQLCPRAQLLWQRTWYFEIGRVGSNGYVYTEEDGPKYNAGMQEICDYMCNEFDRNKPYDVKMVNTGAAWTEARKLNETANLLPYGGLCGRLGINKFGDKSLHSGDGYHDGDIGGGQLLNAYIWYMTLTGNTDLTASQYAPVYKFLNMDCPLPADLIDMLKTAAMNSFK